MIDVKNQLAFATLIAPKSQTNNVGAGGLDTKDFIGQIAVFVAVGTKTVGDADGAIAIRVTHSATNNISNATNYSATNVATSNNATVTNGGPALVVDTRDCLRYIFAEPIVTGTNSPAYPLAVFAVGQKQVR